MNREAFGELRLAEAAGQPRGDEKLTDLPQAFALGEIAFLESPVAPDLLLEVIRKADHRPDDFLDLLGREVLGAQLFAVLS